MSDRFAPETFANFRPRQILGEGQGWRQAHENRRASNTPRTGLRSASMGRPRRVVFGSLLFFTLASLASGAGTLRLSDDHPLALPEVGSYQLRLLAPALVELTLVTTRNPDLPKDVHLDFIDGQGKCRLPAGEDFEVSASGKHIAVKTVGFRRCVIYAPLKKRDLRVGNYLYLKLAGPVADNQTVQVRNPRHDLWPESLRFEVKADPFRWSPVVHVNQTGYLPGFSKKAMVGYFLGNLGEFDLADALGKRADSNLVFQIIDARSHAKVFQGALTPRPDQGFPVTCYQRVLQADFTPLNKQGDYRLLVPGLGASFPFRIDGALAGAFARAYALGIYHQRCGGANALPFTRFTHGPCHTAPAEVPTMAHRFDAVNDELAKESSDYKDNPRHTAPQLKSVAACLYPFVNPGPVDVRGGHHDAGDYSKYTINSAGFVHYLILAADVLPGVANLDNLGLPESGDGKSDILQEAKWEADFLAKMQDADGGFYFLVYPRDREYETDVLPDHGDPQVVFPKTTSVTAAATAALAEAASSPALKKQFPQAAARYLAGAKKGWAFLQRAIAKYGKDGAYQKITHYGDLFMHDDELAWAACELFLATGDAAYDKKLHEWLNPSDPNIRRWGWWRLFDAYGYAIQSYAFAAKTGRLKASQLDSFFLESCQDEIAAAGQDQLTRALQSAYGTSFPEETKRTMTAGWYFSDDAAFDLAIACQVDYPVKRDPRPQMLDALISNLNYEQGCNPVNVTYLTGLGWKRQREIVDQYAWNDRRILPPSGIPLGNIQAGFGWNWVYQKELDELSFPSDGDQTSPYPFYDRWGDGYNLTQEFVILNQARGLACVAWLMAQSPLKTQPWKAAPGKITGLPVNPSAEKKLTFGLSAPGMDLSQARIVWEAAGQQPAFGQTFTFAPGQPGPCWVEAEAQLPDGRRVFGVADFKVSSR